MNSARDRLQFAVRFAQRNLDQLRPGDWMNLRDDLELFLGNRLGVGYSPVDLGGIAAAQIGEPKPQNFSREDFQKLQGEARLILNGLLNLREGHRTALRTGIGTARGPRGTRIDAQYRITINPSNDRYAMLWVEGSTSDVFLLILFHLLSREPSDRIYRCPECKSIFYRVRRQKYCSRQCANRVSVRQWRASEKAEEKEKTRSHKRYRDQFPPKRKAGRKPHDQSARVDGKRRK